MESGDLIVMRGTTQHKWLHSIPKRAQARLHTPVPIRDLATQPQIRLLRRYTLRHEWFLM